MKVKKLTAVALTAAMALTTALSGCGGSQSASSSSSTQEGTKTTENAKNSKSDSIELTFWTLSTRQGAVEPIVEAFNKEHENIKVTASFYDTDGMKDACKVAASSKTLPNMWFNWGGSLGRFYVDNGLTYDLTEYAAENKWSEKFNKNALDLCTFDGKVSGYPTSYNVMGIYYKKDLFEKCGLEVPTTFEEFEQVCATLKENGITPISTGGLYGWHTMRFVELLIEHYAGAELHDKMNTFDESYDNEAVVKALEKYKEFCDKGYFPAGFLTQDPNDTLLALGTGNCAMDIQGQWQDGRIIQNGLDPKDFGVFPFPSGGTDRMSSFAEMTQFNVDNTDEELQACMEFISYYNSEENAEQYGEYFNMPLPLANPKMPEGQPNVEGMIKAGEANGTFTITDQAFPTEVADVLFDAQEAIANGQMEPAEAAQNIQKAIEAYNNK